MLYVPVMKNRKEEVSFLKSQNSLFSDRIIPLIEVISNTYETKYKLDENGDLEYIAKTGKNGRERRSRIKLPKTDEDIITIPDLVKKVCNKDIFVDYFRFSVGEYTGNLNYSKIELSLTNSRSIESYKKCILELCQFGNIIPVISIKKGLEFNEIDLKAFTDEIRGFDRPLGIRITSNIFNNYSSKIEKILQKGDYLFFDIREEDIESQFMELEEFSDFQIDATKILLNSPRKRELRNTAYEESGVTELINNSVAETYQDYGFDGYGDFAGLKDTLPEDAGSNGTGSAMGLLYDKDINAFRVYRNPDTSLGVSGYKEVIEDIMKEKSILDPDNDCLAIRKISELNGVGNWSTWNHITLLRYVDQVMKKMI